MIIAIDFDGTISDEPGYVSKDKLRERPGAFEIINKLKKAGHILCLWTCRWDQYLKEALEWLNENKITFDYINDSPKTKVNNHSRKIYYDLLIDDRCVCALNSWADIIKSVEFYNSKCINKCEKTRDFSLYPPDMPICRSAHVDP